jgi:hypothetical protein
MEKPYNGMFAWMKEKGLAQEGGEDKAALKKFFDSVKQC